MPGGYTLDPLPIRVPARDGESPVSWLRRLAVRYDVPPRDLLKAAGARQPVHATRGAVTRLRNNRRLLAALGLDNDEARRLVRPTPLATATDDYLTTFHGGPVGLGGGSRYCPACLAAPDPHWPDHWQNPLSLVCVRHGCYLTCRCPGCGQPPTATTAWLCTPVPLTACPSRRDAYAWPTRSRAICGDDLTSSPTRAASAEEVAAQQLLHTWAAGSADRTTACGLTITARIGFCALVDLADAALGPNSGLFDLGSDPAGVAAGLAAAARVLTQPNLDAAADAACGLLAVDGPHAPLEPLERIAEHPHNALLAAIQLHSVRARLTPTEQLTFRTGHPAPRYPAPITWGNRTRLRLPDHHPSRPEPSPVWIPQRLWWNAGPAPLACADRTPMRNTVLAAVLSKVGSTRSWAEVCAALDLPADSAERVDAQICAWAEDGLWPDIRDHLDRLMSGLQRHPPPIDYQARRSLGGDLDLLTDALAAGRRRHLAEADDLTLLRQFWERLTGSDIAHAPETLRLDPGSSAYTRFRRTLGVRNADLFHLAHRHLTRTAGVEGPLTWSPEAGSAAP